MDAAAYDLLERVLIYEAEQMSSYITEEYLCHGGRENNCDCRACRAEKERDEAREVILRIGLALRDYVNRHCDGWTNEGISNVFSLINKQSWVNSDK